MYIIPNSYTGNGVCAPRTSLASIIKVARNLYRRVVIMMVFEMKTVSASRVYRCAIYNRGGGRLGQTGSLTITAYNVREE